MRIGFVLAIFAISLPFAAFASGGRSLAVEGPPQIVEVVFGTPRGELQFTRLTDGGHSALLRSVKGDITGLSEVRGPSACDAWLISDKAGEVPRGCDFLFHDEANGTYLSVRSEEMEEGSLFHSMRGIMRGQARYVAL